MFHKETCAWGSYCYSQSLQQNASWWVSTTRLWKLRWQPQAAQVSEASAPSSSWFTAMNSRHPSTAYPPTLAAWFLWHSPYLTRTLNVFDELVESIDTDGALIENWVFVTTCILVICLKKWYPFWFLTNCHPKRDYL